MPASTAANRPNRALKTMRICQDCKKALPYIALYILGLAGVLTFVTGLVSDWNLIACILMFFGGGMLGVFYLMRTSCSLCRRLHRHRNRQAMGQTF